MRKRQVLLDALLGRVQNNRRKTFGTTLGSGYKRTTIKGQNFLVHKLVITAFYGNYDPKLVINHNLEIQLSWIHGMIFDHKDRDRSNNKLENLEIITASENTLHAVNSGHKSLKPVQQLDKNGTIIATFDSIQQASDTTKIIHTSIGKAANGKQKTAGGFCWRFV